MEDSTGDEQLRRMGSGRILDKQAARGAEGLKIWKPFGLEVKDHRGSLARVDDPRLDVLWATAAELRLPVMIHVADPVARRKFARYWRVVRPFSGLTRIVFLREAKRRAEAAA